MSEKRRRQTSPDKRSDSGKLWDSSFVELADFHVSFGYELSQSGEKQLQTRTIHYEGEKERKWDGVAVGELADWIIEQARPALPDSSLPLKAVDPEPEVVPASLNTIEISDLEVSESVGAAYGSSRHAGKSIDAKCAVRFNGSDQEPSKADPPFVVDFFLVDKNTGDSQLVASQSGILNRQERKCLVRQRFSAPATGRYRLYVTARILPPGNGSNQLTGPSINVEI